MNIHSAPRPFQKWGPPTRFATARDVAIFTLCLLLVVGFFVQVLMGPPSPRDPMTAGPDVPGALG